MRTGCNVAMLFPVVSALSALDWAGPSPAGQGERSLSIDSVPAIYKPKHSAAMDSVPGCRQALRPRLLVVVALAAAVYGYNMQAETPLSAGVQLALFAGFLSYKVLLSAQLFGAATAWQLSYFPCWTTTWNTSFWGFNT